MLDRLRYSSEKALHHQIRDAAMVSAQATGDRTMNKIADYFEVHYTLVSLAIERLAEKCMIARLDPVFSVAIWPKSQHHAQPGYRDSLLADRTIIQFG